VENSNSKNKIGGIQPSMFVLNGFQQLVPFDIAGGDFQFSTVEEVIPEKCQSLVHRVSSNISPDNAMNQCIRLAEGAGSDADSTICANFPPERVAAFLIHRPVSKSS